MTQNLLLCVGCDKYDYLNSLSGAERDSREICEILSSGALSCFAEDNCKTLMSPTMREVMESLVSLQDRSEGIESLTFFFAGHGAVVHGSYYLALRDTRLDRMAITGFSLGKLFEFVNEIGVAHCNIIIDACNAAGVVHDIGILLKPEIIGRAYTSGISIFVSSASDQYASETSDGGYGTAAIAKVLRGDVDTGRRSQYLDLLDIGRSAAQMVKEATDGEQCPSVWGMNLYGVYPIHGNPHAAPGCGPSLLSVTGIDPASPAGGIISGGASKLLGLVYADPDELTPERLFDVLAPQVHLLNSIRGASAAFVSGVCRALHGRVETSSNTFAAAQLVGTCFALLLATADSDPASAQVIRELGGLFFEDVRGALIDLEKTLNENPQALCPDGIPDFFYLPQRIARIFGWTSSAIYLADALLIDVDQIDEIYERVQVKLFEVYEGMLCGVSEAEAPFWLVYLWITSRRGSKERGEQIIGSLFNSVIESGGGLARCDVSAKDVVAHLLRGEEQDQQVHDEYKARPSEIISMILVMASLYSLAEVIDADLHRLDHANIKIFIPNNHADFFLEIVRDGVNHVFQVGHGVWRVGDLLQRWEVACRPQLKSDATLEVPEVRVAALFASLIFPDRVPWFLLREVDFGFDDKA